MHGYGSDAEAVEYHVGKQGNHVKGAQYSQLSSLLASVVAYAGGVWSGGQLPTAVNLESTTCNLDSQQLRPRLICQRPRS